eukprot:Hpha_TRINITY_DN15448_c2_g6::TRINITY_DN15448_c2_g6_i1::g.174499::m.174499
MPRDRSDSAAGRRRGSAPQRTRKRRQRTEASASGEESGVEREKPTLTSGVTSDERSPSRPRQRRRVRTKGQEEESEKEEEGAGRRKSKRGRKSFRKKSTKEEAVPSAEPQGALSGEEGGEQQPQPQPPLIGAVGDAPALVEPPPGEAAAPADELRLDADDVGDPGAPRVQWEHPPLPGVSVPVAKNAAQSAVACFSVANEFARTNSSAPPRFAGWYAQSAVTGKFRPTDARLQGKLRVQMGESLGKRQEDPLLYPCYLREHLEWFRIAFGHLRVILVVLFVYQQYTLTGGVDSDFLKYYSPLSDPLQKIFNALSGGCLALAISSYAVQTAATKDIANVAARDSSERGATLTRARWARVHLGVHVLLHAGIVACCLATASFDDFIWELREDLAMRAAGEGEATAQLAKLRQLPTLNLPKNQRCDEWVDG